MTSESLLPVLTCLVGVGVSVMVAGIPWAYGLHGRLTTIEASLKDVLRHEERAGNHEQRLSRLELQLERVLES
jgi:hypothetical protein